MNNKLVKFISRWNKLIESKLDNRKTALHSFNYLSLNSYKNSLINYSYWNKWIMKLKYQLFKFKWKLYFLPKFLYFSIKIVILLIMLLKWLKKLQIYIQIKLKYNTKLFIIANFILLKMYKKLNKYGKIIQIYN